MTIQLTPQAAPPAGSPDPLAPVRSFLLEEARRQAADVRDGAAADADAQVEQARQRAAEILADARERGTADGAATAALERMRARREAREILLRAQRDAYEELRRRTREAVRDLRNHPRYPALRDRLARLAQAHVGSEATITDHPDGGVIAKAPDRRVDYSLDMLADRALDELGAEVEGLWKR